jgi:hypothetical protein
MSASHHWRRRRSAAPLLLTIVDHDTRRFTVEGPVSYDEPWVTEISRAQRAGRKIEFSLVQMDPVNDPAQPWRSIDGYEEWPRKSIIWFE